MSTELTAMTISETNDNNYNISSNLTDIQKGTYQTSRINELYNKLQLSFRYTEQSQHNQSYHKKTHKNILKTQPYMQTSHKMIQNKMKMNQAQKYLDQMLKKRVINRTLRAKTQNDQPYMIQFQRFKKSPRQQRAFCTQIPNQQRYKQPTISPQGLHYYESLRKRPKIMKYLKQKINSSGKKRTLQYSHYQNKTNQRINFLKKRLQGSMQIKIPSNIEANIQKSQKKDEQQINRRIRKIYTSKTPQIISSQAMQAIRKSPILEAQNRIRMSPKSKKLSKIGLQELEKKFQKILKQSVSPISNKKQKFKRLSKVNRILYNKTQHC